MGRRLLRIAAAFAVIAVVAYGVAAVVVYERLTAVPGGCPAAVAANTPATFRVDGSPYFNTGPYAMRRFEEVTFPSRDPAISVSGWFIEATEPGAPAVVVVHGHTRCKRDGSVLLTAGMLHRNGFSVLLVDLRDHGDSTVEDLRYAGGTEEYRDVLGGWDWLRGTKGLPEERIGLLGRSLGAATVLIALGEETGVAAAWEDSGYADIEVAIEAELRRNGYPTFLRHGGVLLARLISGDDLASLSPLRAIGRLGSRPLFITHGDRDDRLSVTYAEDLARAVREGGGTVDPWIVAGSGHTRSLVEHPDEYERRMVAFFRAALNGDAD